MYLGKTLPTLLFGYVAVNRLIDTVSPWNDAMSFLHHFQSQIKNIIPCLCTTSIHISLNVTHNILSVAHAAAVMAKDLCSVGMPQ